MRYNAKVLAGFLDRFPVPARQYIYLLIEHPGFRIIMTNQRKSRHGSFAASRNGQLPVIRINYFLTPHLFLLVFLHELAHFNVWAMKANRHLPHGREWKDELQKLLLPLTEIEELNENFRSIIKTIIKNPKATFNNEPRLLSLISLLDSGKELKTVRDLNEGATFHIGHKRFVKMGSIRTRTKCYCPDDKKYYLVSLNAQIVNENN